MKVRKVFHTDVITIEAWETVREAARRMRSKGCSCLPVMSGGELVGIITERDVVEAVAANENLGHAAVFDYMTEDPQAVSADDDCSEAASEMLAVGCRHLPVVDSTGLIGVISARDLLPLALAGRVE